MKCSLILVALLNFAALGFAQTSRPGSFRACDELIESAIAEKKCPGAVLLVGRGDEVVCLRAYGDRAVEPEKRQMTVDTIFDLASLTKPIATATSVMILADRRKLQITDKVSAYLPEFAAGGKQDVTIEDLLLHRGGLPPDDDLSDYSDGPAAAWKRILATPLAAQPRERFIYSDVGFLSLGKLVEKVSGTTLDSFAEREIFAPLGMIHTRYLPPASWRDHCAPTERREGHWMLGEVHDPRAFALGGVAGHAGLFGTAEDLSRFCQMLLHGGELDGKRILHAGTVMQMISSHPLPGGLARGLGFDIDTPYSGCRGDRFERGTTLGHTGFTGTMFWVDPANQCYVILLTNSVHPDGKGNVLKLRHDVATAAAEAMLGRQSVLCGIDVLERQKFACLAGKRIGVVTNQTGLDVEGRRTIDLLAKSRTCKLVRIFSPEHGIAGAVDTQVADATDAATGLPIISLYGDVRKPTPKMLADLDALVFDIQDAGVRFYTFETTLGLCMEACAERKIPMFVLDRPNPLGGERIDGPIADANDLGFTCYAPLPVMHGMTMGELARYFKGERHIGCELTVLPLEHWRRSMAWDETGRLWVNPSPNLRNPTQALLYPAIGLLEATNVSVGRGTDQPFETFGAPWIDALKLAAELNAADLPGLKFVPIEFKPTSNRFAGQVCHGCYVEVIDRTKLEPVRSGLMIARTLRQLSGEKFEIRQVGTMLRNRATLEAIENGSDFEATWKAPLDEFRKARAKYLLYP